MDYTRVTSHLFLTSGQLRVVMTVLALLLVSCGGGVKQEKLLGAEESFRLAKVQYDKSNYLRSSEEFQRVVFNYPGSSLVDTAQYYLAMSYLNDKQYELAGVEFDRLLTSYPNSPYAVNSQYMKGYAYFLASPGHYGLDQEELVKALKTLEEFAQDHPESELIPEAKKTILTARTRLARKEYNAGVHYLKVEAYEAAIIYFQRVIDEYTDTDIAVAALLGIARCHFKQKEYAKSTELVNSFLTLYPSHQLTPQARALLLDIQKEQSKRPTTPAATASDSAASKSSNVTVSTGATAP